MPEFRPEPQPQSETWPCLPCLPFPSPSGPPTVPDARPGRASHSTFHRTSAPSVSAPGTNGSHTVMIR